MRTILLTLFGVLCVATAAAQTDTLATAGDLKFRRGGREGEMVLELGGYGVTLGKGVSYTAVMASESGRRAKPVRWGLGFGSVELGFSLLTMPGYGGYTKSQRDFLDQRVGKSIHFGFRFFNLRVALNKQRNLFLGSGIHFMCDNYTLQNSNLTLERIDGQIVPVSIEGNFKKSKLTTASLGIPLQVAYFPIPKFSISAQLYGDVVFNSHTKYKKPKSKADLAGVNTWQCGAGVALSYKGFGIYCKYGLSEFFRSGVGPKTHPVTLGFYFGR